MGFVPFESIASAMDAARSVFFGVGRSPRNPESYYNRLDTSELTFDVSNNQILCSITAEGLLEHACSLKGVSRGGPDANFVGAYVTKHVAAGGPWPFAVQVAGREAKALHELPGVAADLLGVVLPLFTYRLGALRARQLVFAPFSVGDVENSPRALIVALEVRNEGSSPCNAAIVPPRPEAAGSREQIVPLDVGGMNSAGRCEFSLAAGERRVFSFAIGLGRDAEEARAAVQAVRRRTPLQWLNETLAYHARRLGELSIPEGPFWAESFVRMAELSRQSVLRLPDGGYGGSFWGSRFTGPDAWETPFVWLKDAYHAMLPMGMLHPSLCADAALWFLEWGMPEAPFGRRLRRFPAIGRVNHSLSNALAAFQLAGEYYRTTGDGEFFLSHPELLSRAGEIFQELLTSRRGEVFLFPSLYISDGDARGDYHTGSNVVACDALAKMARLAREVYHDRALADEWAESAEKLRRAIFSRCVGEDATGRRFFEGANADGTFVPGHDGEETDTTLMPFYGLCEQDDEALLSHARLALSDANPLYWPEMDGVWWTDGEERFGATFPAWMTALAGAADEAELARRLERIRRLTDLDGSVWWWPYRAGATDPAAPTREPSGMKCGWAAGVYLCLFVDNIIGLWADRPARAVSFRPFCPWSEFAWKQCRLGESVFDVSYCRRASEVSCEIVNHNKDSYDGRVELIGPKAAEVARCSPSDVEPARRYGRASVVRRARIEPGQALRLCARFD
ncbi:MAG: hypothetical protein ACYTF6_11050 [Planctomycetota bacterium]|jgi:hypothetical protein